MAIDPVCLMEVDEATAKWTSEYKGQMYYFCAPGCKASFDEDPEKYLSGEAEQHDHSGHEHDHSMHANHDHSAHESHDRSAHDRSADNGHDHSEHSH
jgi:YHS domain-containing protein